MHLVTPKVYLVGYSGIDRPGLYAYLRDTGNVGFIDELENAIQAGVTEGEALCSFYAKLCYGALTVGHNDNITRVRGIEANIRDGILGSAHGSVLEHVKLNFVIRNCSRIMCFTAEAEVFTRDRGWVSVKDLTTDDFLLVLNPETRKAGWRRPKSVRSFKYSGKIFWWANRDMKAPGVTEDHLLWAAPYDLRKCRGLKTNEIATQHTEKIPAASLFDRRFVVQSGFEWAAAHDEESIRIGAYEYDAFDLVTWLGWVATDGSFVEDRSNQTNISQSKAHNLPLIRELMNRLFACRWREHGPYGEGSQVLFAISDEALTRFAKEHLGPNKEDRRFSPWLLTLSRRLLRAFIATAVAGDGNVHGKTGHEVIYCPSEFASGQYQTILGALGQSASVRTDERVGKSHLVAGKPCGQTKPSYVVSIDRKGFGAMVKPKHQLVQNVKDMDVYCPETEEGVIYVRHKGQPFWSGNTHEQVRHRQGYAYSQTSGRYCRSDDFGFVWDPILKPVEVIGRHVLNSLQQVYNDMVDRCGLNGREGVVRAMTQQIDVSDGRLEQFHELPPADEAVDTYIRVHLQPIGITDPDNIPFAIKKQLTSALRRFLPNGMANELGFSVNLRAVRHTIMLRTSRHAEREIREVWGQVYSIVKEKFPLMVSDAKVEIVDGLPEITGMRQQPYDRKEEN